LSLEEIRDQDLFPLGFMPLPHELSKAECFPKLHIDEVKAEERDLTDST
jgi:hypothetical protein